MRMNYDQIKAEIERCGLVAGLGPHGEGWEILQNSHELATFLAAIGPIETFLEIGTGPKGGTARFCSEVMGFQVTTVDVVDYKLTIPGIQYVVLPKGVPYWTVEGAFDAVFLDGPHDYAGIKQQYKHYKTAAPIIAVHDIAGLRACHGSYSFWRELSRDQDGEMKCRFHEAIAEDPERIGIGWHT